MNGYEFCSVCLMNRDELWEKIDPLIRPLGCEIFEIEMPGKGQGLLRVFIAKVGGGTIGVDDCARVSRQITAIDERENFLSDSWSLEVSSPGVNRKLTRAEHFRGAIGERIKVSTVGPVKISADKEVSGVRRGVLLEWNGEGLVLDDELLKERVSIPLSSLKDARVDFQFDAKRDS